MPEMRLLRAAWLPGAVCLACAGTSRGSFDGAVYRHGPIAFRMPPAPASWRRLESEDATLAYRDDARGSAIVVNARCRRSEDGTPLLALTNHLLMGSTARDVVLQETVPFDGREALHSKVRARWDGVPFLVHAFVLKKDGCTYDFVEIVPDAGTAERTPATEFEAFVSGFRTLPGSGVVAGTRE